MQEEDAGENVGAVRRGLVTSPLLFVKAFVPIDKIHSLGWTVLRMEAHGLP